MTIRLRTEQEMRDMTLYAVVLEARRLADATTICFSDALLVLALAKQDEQNMALEALERSTSALVSCLDNGIHVTNHH